MKKPPVAGRARRTFSAASVFGLLLAGAMAATLPSAEAEWTCVGNTAETFLPEITPQTSGIHAEVCTDPLEPGAASICAEVGSLVNECRYLSGPICNLDLSSICIRLGETVTLVEYSIGTPTTFTVVPSANAVFAPTAVQGFVDRYAFFSGSVVVPCIVITVGNPTNACQAAGGAFLQRDFTIIDDTRSTPTGAIAMGGLSVRTCESYATASVDGLGLTRFPFAIPC